MNPFDILIIVVLGYSLVRGLFRGLVKEVSSIIGVLGGFYAAYTYYKVLAGLLAGLIHDTSYLNILSFLIIFCGVLIVVGVLGVVIKYLLNIAFLGWVDRIGGVIFGVLKKEHILLEEARKVIFLLMMILSPDSMRDLILMSNK